MTFDLKAARKVHGDGSPGFYLPREIMDTFSAALDEIERLQADIITHDDAWHNDRAANAKRIAELEADLEYYKSGFHSERGVHERVAAILGTDDAPWMLAQRAIERIAELEVDNQRWREYNQQLYRANRKKHAALRKLGQVKRERGKALVDARQQSLAHYPQDFNSPRWEELAKMAREQLAREGKL